MTWRQWMHLAVFAAKFYLRTDWLHPSPPCSTAYLQHRASMADTAGSNSVSLRPTGCQSISRHLPLLIWQPSPNRHDRDSRGAANIWSRPLQHSTPSPPSRWIRGWYLTNLICVLPVSASPGGMEEGRWMPHPGDVEISGAVLEQKRRQRQRRPGVSPALRHEARPGSAPRLGAQPLTRAATTGRQAVFSVIYDDLADPTFM